MSPGFFGGISALGLGTADFMGRFSSRALGHHNALLGMLSAGLLLLTGWLAFTDGLPPWPREGLAWIGINGAATTVMTLLLYLGLARGPVSVVAPIVAAHPVLVVLFYIAVQGLQPDLLQMAAMIGTIIGTIIVAQAAEADTQGSAQPRQELHKTIAIAVGSSFAYAVLILAGQAAAPIHGEINTLWYGRLVSLVTLLLFFLLQRRTPGIPLRWWPFLGAQGLLDAGGYIALFAGSTGPGKEVAAVVASTFGAVTVLLARVILKERISLLQWSGIWIIFAGVLVLSG